MLTLPHLSSLRKKLAAVIVAIILMVLVAACASAPRPDLARLYALQTNSEIQQPPVIVIHGLMGARLSPRSGGKEVWTGSLLRLLFHDYAEVALDIDPKTLEPLENAMEAAEITDQAAGRDFYGRILGALESAGGFVRNEPGMPVQARERKYYVFTYDWRQDNVKSAKRLDSFLSQVREDFGQPDLKVDIIAHSMGGLVARYYARYGTVDVLDDNEFPVNNHGAQYIRRAILLGTPSLGSAKTIDTFVNGFKIVFSSLPPEALATFPSAYQLLPHPINRSLVDTDGRELDLDLFSAAFWRRRELSVFDPKVIARIKKGYDTPAAGQQRVELLQRYFEKHIERARRFVWSLTVPAGNIGLRYIVFGGDCQLTPARVVLESVGGHEVIRFDPKEIENPNRSVDYEKLMLEPGDGIVTRASLLARRELNPQIPRHEWSNFPLDYAFFLCEAHDQITGNINFEDNLLNALLSVDPN